ncbi:MAG: hypothetical protein SFW67_02985 [Myxococcaceae bacterium]|nr:hypothetical protein [Myxococcaceae bacterium]
MKGPDGRGLELLERALEAGSFMLRLSETLTPFAVVSDAAGKPGLVSIDARSADADELEMQLVTALQGDAKDGVISGAAWAYTIDVRTPDYDGPALKVYVDVQGERPFVAYTPYTFSMGDPAELGETHVLEAEASVLFPSVTAAKRPRVKKKPAPKKGRTSKKRSR